MYDQLFFEVEYVNDPGLTVSIQSDPSPAVLTCLPGSAATLTGTPPPHSDFQGQWAQFENNQFVDIPGATAPGYTTSVAGTYLYTLSGPVGCTASNIATVSTPLLPGIAIDPPEQPLNACSQTITGVVVGNTGSPGNSTIGWTTSGSGILLGGETTNSPVIAALGVYMLTVSRQDNGCTATATVQIVPGVIPTVSAQITSTSGSDVLDCNATTHTLQASAGLSVGTSSYTYAWSTGTVGETITVDAPGIYSVTATAASIGCQGAADILIFQDVSNPALQILSLRDTVCAGENIALTAMASEPVAFLWQNNSTTSTLLAIPDQNGPNAYTVTVTAGDNGCTTSATKWIERVEQPQITCMEDALTVPNGGLAAIDCPIAGTQLIWLAVSTNVRNIPPSGVGPVQGQLVELANPLAPGVVEYAFFARNAGCTSDRADVRVAVLPESADNIFIPELITPDGDGQNDTWGIIVPESISNPDAYGLALFNRYGALAWEANLATPFHADQYPDGTYYYVVSKPDGGKISGAITILRRK
ncbi:MAG: gliding motility-associated C-terminal domain-containing protein [Lewinellaceae bacterium]|nr:gliding motility-associated C-terminal domain-containing protein [Lewinellaceae bacterium]